MPPAGRSRPVHADPIQPDRQGAHGRETDEPAELQRRREAREYSYSYRRIVPPVPGEFFLGAVLDWVWTRVSPDTQKHYAIASASGLIAGEALVAVLIPLLVTIGLMSLP